LVGPIYFKAIVFKLIFFQKSLQFNPEESVWAAKQQILLSVAKVSQLRTLVIFLHGRYQKIDCLSSNWCYADFSLDL